MEIILLTARVILAFVFGVAGVAKLKDREGSRRALTSFGVPQPFVVSLGWALPIGELVAALALLSPLTAWWGAVSALALLLSFTAAITRSLMRGQSPDCRCFGQLHAAPVTRTYGYSSSSTSVAAGAAPVASPPSSYAVTYYRYDYHH